MEQKINSSAANICLLTRTKLKNWWPEWPRLDTRYGTVLGKIQLANFLLTILLVDSPVAVGPPYQPQPAFVPGGMPPPMPGFNPTFPQRPPTGQLYPDMGFSAPTCAPKWLPASNGTVPPNAVQGGTDCSGEPIYVARASHEGALLPGKLVPSHRVAYVAWGGRENPKEHYEVRYLFVLHYLGLYLSTTSTF